ncbi:Las1 [Dillenia turbinata]|uniref:Las1 n=1 Tax=Dillenia turbinata TaxID=194707 RepID=A0AAN8YX25_9MAGN
MESLLGFNETTTMTDYFHGRRKTPSDSLFSSSPDSVASALDKVPFRKTLTTMILSLCSDYGICLASQRMSSVVIEITAAFVEIQQKDPFFRPELDTADPLKLEELHAMLYSMAIVRLVNGVVERACQKNTNLSLAEAGGSIQLPRMLIDVHHGFSPGSPFTLTSSPCLHKGATYSYIFGKHKTSNSMPIYLLHGHQTDGIIMALDIVNDFAGVISYFPSWPASSSLQNLLLRKFNVLNTGKPVFRTLKTIVKLYSSFPLEVVSVFVELLLNLSDISSSTACTSSEASQNVDNFPSALDDWKLVIVKLSKNRTYLSTFSRQFSKWPHGLKKAWYQKQGLKCVHHKSSVDETESSSEKIQLSKQTLLELLRECLRLTAPSNVQLKDSALLLAQMAENVLLSEKLEKLPLQGLSNLDGFEDDSALMSYNSFLDQQESSILKAASQVEFVKQCLMKRNGKRTRNSDGKCKSRWVMAKSWSLCPIGMLPSDIGSGGNLPNLDCISNLVEIKKPISSKDHCQVNGSNGNRKASPEVPPWEGSCVKRMRGTVEKQKNIYEDIEVDVVSGIKDRLLIGGAWKKVRKDELLSILSSSRLGGQALDESLGTCSQSQM